MHKLLSLIFFLSFPAWMSAQIQIKKPDIDKGNPFSIPFGTDNSVSVPFQYINNFIVVDVIINNAVPLKFIFDTGSETSIITDLKVVQSLKIPRGRLVEVYGADRSTRIPAQILPFITLNMGSLQFEYFPILLLLDDYFNTSTSIGIETHGIIGADLLKRFIVEINPSDRVLVFHKRLPPTYKLKKYTLLDCDYIKGRFFVDLDLEQNGKKSVENFLIDTGANRSVVYRMDSIDQELSKYLIPTTISQGLGGDIRGYLGLAQNLDLKEGKQKNIPIQYHVIEQIDPEVSFKNGIIGNPILKQFDMIFDYGKGQIYLKKNKLFSRGVKRDKSGIYLYASGPGLNKFIVSYVVPNSPADKVGILKNDQIIAVKGINKRLLGLTDINRKFQKKSGKRIKLKIKRDEETLIHRIELEDYLLKNFS